MPDDADLIAAATMLGVPLDPAWHEAVRFHLVLSLRAAHLVGRSRDEVAPRRLRADDARHEPGVDEHRPQSGGAEVTDGLQRQLDGVEAEVGHVTQQLGSVRVGQR